MERSDNSIQTKDASSLYIFDLQLIGEKGIRCVGIDEAGRGPLAGPVAAAAVMLDYEQYIDGIDDSKKLTARNRERLYGLITASATAWAIGLASVEEIERLNILQATFLAMYRALSGIGVEWDCVLVDGNRPMPQLPQERQRTIVGGDGLSASIAAASILAKVTRDRIMLDFHQQYPAYRFDLHKGYGTALHRSMIGKFGLCPVHRKSFCGAFVTQYELDLEGKETSWLK